MDATCTPADIRYPTDLSLLNEAREKTEGIIDTLHQRHKGKRPKARTYRKKARKEYLAVAKKRKPSAKKIRQAIRKQLQCVRRNLQHIENLSREGNAGGHSDLRMLNRRMHKNLLVIKELYRQQKKMYDEKTHRVEHRIVSISQPHVRPIVRGKASADVEFGAKISVALVDGYAFLEKLSWEAYNEAGELKDHLENYKSRFGHYPESVHVDQIYRNRENRRYCKERGIKMSGPPLGRRPNDPCEKSKVKKETRQSEIDRIPIEGKFGNGKRRYGMDNIMTKLQETGETTIAADVLMLNLEKLLRELLFAIFYRLMNWIKYFQITPLRLKFQ